MKAPEFYRDREQTYVKHLFLEKYLERVAYNIGSFRHDFVYVDGFSGPWRSEDEGYGDTSFGIAIEKLRQVQRALREKGHPFNARCLFIEKNPRAFHALQTETSQISDIEVVALNGEFESLIDQIVKFIGRSFSLIFVDPTGWTGFGLNTISPVLRLRGEVLVNFMYNDINRHLLENPQPSVIQSFDPLFGGPGWQAEIASLIAAGDTREDAVVETYRRRFKAAGTFPYATTTRVLNPLSDRTYFYLVYGTRHRKGLIEFRNVEKAVVDVQEQVRDAAKLDYRVARTGQAELFGAIPTGTVPIAFQEERRCQCEAALLSLRESLVRKRTMTYEDLLCELLERRLVWESDIKDWLLQLQAAGEIKILGLRPKERTPKPGHFVVWTGPET